MKLAVWLTLLCVGAVADESADEKQDAAEVLTLTGIQRKGRGRVGAKSTLWLDNQQVAAFTGRFVAIARTPAGG